MAIEPVVLSIAARWGMIGSASRRPPMWMRMPLHSWRARLAAEEPRVLPDTISAAADTPAQEGEIGAFEPFVRRYERQVLNYLWSMTGDEQTARDLAQETFLRAWQHYATISRYEQPRGWLFRIATNLALTHNATRQRRAATTGQPLFEGDSSPATSDVARRVVERDLVREVLLQLPAKRRAALVLREVYGLAGAEIAATLGMSEPAVRMALSRARERFRKLYEREEDDDD
jgi:RNA polymerase sigma-70 factor (ECF subfamily)